MLNLDNLTLDDIENVSPEIKHEILWRKTARPNQLPPPDNQDWMIWIARMGRGSGKTRLAAEHIRWLAETGQIKNFIIAGRTQSETIKIQVKGPSGLLACSPLATYYPSTAEVRWPNGTVGNILSSEKPDAFRGFSTDLVWCDELGSWSKAQESWDNIFYGLREGQNPKIIITTTPSLHPLLKSIEEEWDDIYITTGSTYDNKDNLPDRWLKALEKKYDGTAMAQQELYGEYLIKLEGAHYQNDWIQRRPYDDNTIYRRTVVSIDPAVTNTKTSDTTGIAVLGERYDNTYDLLYIKEGKWHRKKWGRLAVDLTKQWQAKLVIEDNQGKELLRDVIENVDPTIRVHLQSAKVSKEERIDDAAFLYEKGLVYHAYKVDNKGNPLEDPNKKFEKFEQKLVTWRNVKSDGSPGDLDAHAQGLLRLVRKQRKHTKISLPDPKQKIRIAKISPKRNFRNYNQRQRS